MSQVETRSGEITLLLRMTQAGDGDARGRLFDLMYSDLRRLASYYLRRERRDQTLQPTALVHEAYLKLFGSSRVPMNDRHHFLALAAQVMRRLLVDRARSKATLRRASQGTTELTDSIVYADNKAEEMLALDAALDQLARFAPRQCRVVEMRFFGGMLEGEIAHVLQVSERTVKRDWAMAKVWLYSELKGEPRA